MRKKYFFRDTLQRVVPEKENWRNANRKNKHKEEVEQIQDPMNVLWIKGKLEKRD